MTDDNILEFLWDKLPKTTDGEHTAFTQGDIDMLWHIGFVDTDQYSLEEWQKAFEGYKSGDEAIMAKADWLTLDRYRFKDEVLIPFNAQEINEGKYTDEGLQELVDQSFLPSMDIGTDDLQKKVEALKKTYREDSGLIEIRDAAKKEMAQWLLDDPSPRRRLELIYAHMYLEHAVEYIKTGEMGSATAAGDIAKIEASTFSLLSSSSSEQRAVALKTLEKASLPKMPEVDEKKKGTPLKAFTRSRRGVKS